MSEMKINERKSARLQFVWDIGARGVGKGKGHNNMYYILEGEGEYYKNIIEQGV